LKPSSIETPAGYDKRVFAWNVGKIGNFFTHIFNLGRDKK
jgi:hypothetical protein